MGRDDRIYQEAAALWRELYDEPPPRDAVGTDILGMIVGGLSDPDYERLANPHLRASNITFPK
jgi:hypothetical protein